MEILHIVLDTKGDLRQVIEKDLVEHLFTLRDDFIVAKMVKRFPRLTRKAWPSDRNSSLLHYAMAYGTSNTLRIILNAGANANGPSVECEYPLHSAIKRRDSAAVRILLEYVLE
jgi:ankyrin repeat protein